MRKESTPQKARLFVLALSVAYFLVDTNSPIELTVIAFWNSMDSLS